MGRLDDVLATINAAVSNAIVPIVGTTIGATSDGEDIVLQPGQVIIGWPLAPELNELLGQGNGIWQVSLYPQKGAQNTTRFRPRRVYTMAPVTVFAIVDGGQVTFGGTPAAGLNINIVINRAAMALVQTNASQALDAYAVAAAEAVNALELPGVSATASGTGFTVTGGNDLAVNVSGSGTASREVVRVARDIQMSVWASDPDTASAIEGAVLPVVGVDVTPKLALPDGTLMWVRYGGELWDDDSQLSYSLYASHHQIWVEYGVMQTQPAYQIGATELLISTNTNTPLATLWSGGP